jgi:hypothetical protein
MKAASRYRERFLASTGATGSGVEAVIPSLVEDGTGVASVIGGA